MNCSHIYTHIHIYTYILIYTRTLQLVGYKSKSQIDLSQWVCTQGIVMGYWWTPIYELFGIYISFLI